MTSSWTAPPLLARSAGSAAERHPSDSRQGQWIFAVGPRWARATAVAHGHQRSLRSGGTAGRRPLSSRSWDNTSERIRLWSRGSESAPAGQQTGAGEYRLGQDVLTSVTLHR